MNLCVLCTSHDPSPTRTDLRFMHRTEDIFPSPSSSPTSCPVDEEAVQCICAVGVGKI